ncbi:MAG TPA: thioredoxin family protein [Pseudomonas sp.]|nr:thioredoxin family protein [Pseudomonas sp.]
MASYRELCAIGESFTAFVGHGLPSEIAAVDAVLHQLAAEGGVSAASIARLHNLKRRYHLLVAGEMWCPDCQINIAVFDFIQRSQPLIEQAIITKGRAEDDLRERLGLEKIRIPLAAVLDADFQLLGCFVERPQQVIAGGQAVLADYRAGKFLDSTIRDLLDIIEAAEQRAAS